MILVQYLDSSSGCLCLIIPHVIVPTLTSADYTLKGLKCVVSTLLTYYWPHFAVAIVLDFILLKACILG
jgi:hypothetical protein